MTHRAKTAVQNVWEFVGICLLIASSWIIFIFTLKWWLWPTVVTCAILYTYIAVLISKWVHNKQGGAR